MIFANVSCSNDIEQTKVEAFSKEDLSNKPPKFDPNLGTENQANGFTLCSSSCNAGCETGWAIYTDGQGRFYKHYWSVSQPYSYNANATQWITTKGGVVTWHETTWVTSCNG